MEGLLPLLIAVGASIALSLLKKKPAPPGESDRLPQDSPWDDLLREIQRKETAQAEVEPETVETDEMEREPIRRIISATPTPKPTPETQKEAAPVFADSRHSAPFSYDDDAVAAALERLEDVEEENRLYEIMSLPAEEKRDEIAAGEVTDAIKTENAEDAFAEGFDPRMAVLYSEVLRPKYQE